MLRLGGVWRSRCWWTESVCISSQMRTNASILKCSPCSILLNNKPFFLFFPMLLYSFHICFFRSSRDPSQQRVKKWGFSLEEALKDPAGRDQFLKFLESEFSSENLRWGKVAIINIFILTMSHTITCMWNGSLGVTHPQRIIDWPCIFRAFLASFSSLFRISGSLLCSLPEAAALRSSKNKTKNNVISRIISYTA